MRLTKQCKEDFKKWLVGFGRGIVRYPYKTFRELEPQMQYGVYVDFFDVHNIYICDNIWSTGEEKEFMCQIETELSIWNTIGKNRDEVRVKAIGKANEIYNKL